MCIRDRLDATSAELKATYQEIKDYVLKESGLKVSSLYISQVKRKCGIEVGENYNLPKSENARVPQCPKEKEDAIKAALKLSLIHISRYYLGMRVSEIAVAEGVDPSRVRDSIRRGLKQLAKYF